jgi:hypothetical protein
MALTRAKTKAGALLRTRPTADLVRNARSYRGLNLCWSGGSTRQATGISGPPLAEARLSSVSGRASCWWNAHMAAVLGLADRLALNS